MKRAYTHSLQGRLLVLSGSLFIVLLWVLVFISSTIQQRQFSDVLFEQQNARAKRLAADLDNKFQERILMLERAASALPLDLHPEALDGYLSRLAGMHIVFTGGIAVIGIDGRTIADFPVAPGRRGTYFGDRDYFARTVATRKPYIDKPIMGRALKRPVLTIAVPVFDVRGRLRAVMTGITDLAAPNFLGIELDPSISGHSEFFIVSPRENVIVSATDAKRILTAPPARGINPMYDRFVDGFEGTGIAVGSTGVSYIYAGKYLATKDWLVMAALPAAVGLKPVMIVQNYLVTAAAALTILSIFVLHWMMTRLLSPLGNVESAMRRIAEGDAPPASLTIDRDDEIGGMIGNFNALLQHRHRDQKALAESEQRFRLLVENAPDAIFVQTNGCFAYANAAALRLLGATSKEQLLLQPLVSRIPPELHDVLEARLQLMKQTRESVSPFEQKVLRFDGEVAYAEVSAIPIYYENAEGALVFARDITDRKRALKALRESEERFQGLVALSSEWYWELDEQYRFNRIYGWDGRAGFIREEQFLGKTRWEVSSVSDESVWMEHRAVLDARLPFVDFEYCTRMASGNTVWFSINGEPQFGDEGRFTGYRGTGKHITRRKVAEEAMRRSQARIRELAAHQAQIKEEERKRIARDIHDDLGQMLLTLHIDVSVLAAGIDESQTEMRETLCGLLGQIDATMKSVKRIINDLRPSVLDLGLSAAIEWQVNEFKRSSGIACTLVVENEDFDRFLDENRSAALFRAVQESLANIIRHARADMAGITIHAETGRLVISMTDNGIGIAPGSVGKKDSFGLAGIEERLSALGGNLTINSMPGVGTTLILSIPFSDATGITLHIETDTVT